MASPQTELNFGKRLRDQGINSVESNNYTWAERMRAVARIISMQHGSVSADDLRRYADKHNDQPGHSNAWGSLFRPRGWQMVGRKKSTIPSNHAREIRIWRWAPNANQA